MIDAYPAGPHSAPPDLTKPTPKYRQLAWLALASLVLFVCLYFSLAAWFVWTAFRMFDGQGSVLHWLIGGCAAFLALFMFKALYFIKRGGAPDAIEVTRAGQPQLLDFLERLADEAGAPRPHRVFLSAKVNACVFYDLSLFNLIFPSRKNLEIGLALVNVLTLSELKAVLAHEFGHFAQRSMAIGTWVYIAQQIAAELVAKRDVLDRTLRTLSHMDVRIAWLGWLLSLVVWSIRSLMETMLRLVVLAQRALARQMEFQADLVAVSLTGSDELVHALHKLTAADEAWSMATAFIRTEVAQGRLPHDVFAVQERIIDKVGQILGDPDYGRIPLRAATEPPETRRVFKSSFARLPQMWATHPASADRELNVRRRYVSCPHDARSAWLLFDKPEALRHEVLVRIAGETNAQPASPEQTLQSLDRRYTLLQHDSRYRGTFLNRPLTRHASSIDELFDRRFMPDGATDMQGAIYPEKLADDMAQWRQLSEEHQTLATVRDRASPVAGGRIVFRGETIPRRALPQAIAGVKREEDEVMARILACDKRCRSLHMAAAAQVGASWPAYLEGLLGALHYAEHSLADVRDAQGAFRNVLAIVTADGKVSHRELGRLLKAADALYRVFCALDEQRPSVSLDRSLVIQLNGHAWSTLLPSLSLPPVSQQNINAWLPEMEAWVEQAASSLNALRTAALEQLLAVEDWIAEQAAQGNAAPEACRPTQVPSSYAILLQGQERKRQTRLGLWDRFQTADGWIAAAVRLLIASSIIVVVLGYEHFTG